MEYSERVGYLMNLKDNKEAAIGVFDSGVGGLTVAREIMRHLPNEKIVYFGDTARVPYGSKSRDTIIRYSRQIINFLQTQNVKAIVIACNTASALALDVVSQEVEVPVMGVVVPGARAAMSETRNNHIGVLATEATINSGLYTTIMQSGRAKMEVKGKACPLFVPIVEEGLAKTKIAEDIIDLYLDEIKESEVDTLILGCTHYPLLRSRIRKYLGEDIHLVNPAYETAMDLKGLLQSRDMVRSLTKEQPKHEFFVSDAPEKFMTFANSMLPYDISDTKKINIEEY